MSNKFIKTILMFITSSLVMVGLYFNIPLAVGFLWVMYPLALTAMLLCHIALNIDSKVRAEVVEKWAEIKNRSLARKVYTAIWKLAWVGMLLYVERYNLLGVLIACWIADAAMRVRL